MENPFKYGGVVRGPYFTDRKSETDELKRAMENLNRVFLVSPRRFGKTLSVRHYQSKRLSIGAPLGPLGPLGSSLRLTLVKKCQKSNVDLTLIVLSLFWTQTS
jgi:hypothetical protein